MTNDVKHMEKWTVLRSIHLGFVKESVSAGTVIECDRENNRLIIEGRTFDSIKDLDILCKHGWVRPFGEQASEDEQMDERPLVQPSLNQNPNKKNIDLLGMSIESCDQDNMPDPIDISHTKMHGQKRATKKNTMEIIRGDETAAERLDRLQAERPKMPIVKADEREMAMADGYKPLNSGQITPRNAEEVERLRQEAIAKSEARKMAVEKKRTGDKQPSEPTEPDSEQSEPVIVDTATPEPVEPVTETTEPGDTKWATQEDKSRKTGTINRKKSDE